MRAVLGDVLLRLVDGAVHLPQPAVAGVRLDARRLDLLPRLLQHGQRTLGIFFTHRLGLRLVVRHVSKDLAGEGLLRGAGFVQRPGRLARCAIAQAQTPGAGEERNVVLQPLGRHGVELAGISACLSE